MWVCVRDVDGFVGCIYSSCFNPFYLFVNFLLNHSVFTSVRSQFPRWFWANFTPSAQRNLTTATCSTVMQSIHIYLTLTSTRLRAQLCVVHVRTTHLPLRTHCTASRYHVMFKASICMGMSRLWWGHFPVVSARNNVCFVWNWRYFFDFVISVSEIIVNKCERAFVTSL